MQPIRPDTLPQLLDTKAVLERWGCGSRSSLRRAEKDGLLVPRRFGRRLAFRWEDVWEFEGGQPPDDMKEAYRAQLLTAEQISLLCPLSPEDIDNRARRGEIPARHVFRTFRFVPREIKRWLETE